MKKKFLCCLLAAAMVLSFGACKKAPEVTSDPQEVPEEKNLTFSRENFPKMDGSTSLVPLGQGIASVLLGESREEVLDLISFNKTTQSFRNLYYGDCDIVIAAEPKSDVFDEMTNEGFEYEIETIAKEALVFVVNADNPIDSLTTEQLQDIYTGKITNWSQVGGNDAEIVAFQRNPGAGSQVMMEKLVMGDKEMMVPPTDQIEQEMGGLIESVKSYDNSANAIGYTVYYYAADMKVAEGLKILSVNNVLPEPDSIRSEDYPFINGYYCCIPAKAEENSPSRLLYNWLISDSGQKLLTLEGYVSVYNEGEAPTKGDDVIVDYSSYVPYSSPTPQFTRLSEEPLTSFTTSKGYGQVMPYCGTMKYVSYSDSLYNEANTYGFFSSNGQLITDPVYNSINCFSFEDEKYDPIWTYYYPDGDNTRGGFVSFDGSKKSPKEYDYIWVSSNYIFCENFNDVRTTDVYSPEGDLIVDGSKLDYEGRKLHFSDAWNDGFAAFDEECEVSGYSNNYYHLDKNFNVVSGPWAYASKFENGMAIVQNFDGTTSILDENYQKISFNGRKDFQWISHLIGSLVFTEEDGTYYLYDKTGKLIDSGADTYDFRHEKVYSKKIVDGGVKLCLYDENGKQICAGLFPSSNPENEYILYSGVGSIFYQEDYYDDNVVTLCDIKTGETTVLRDSYFSPAPDGFPYLTIYSNTDNKTPLKWYDKDLKIVRETNDFYGYEDIYSKTNYLITSNSDGFEGSAAIYNSDYTSLITLLSGEVAIYNGYYLTDTDYASSCYDKDGKLIFCYTRYGSASGD